MNKFLEIFFSTPVTFSKGEQKVIKFLYTHQNVSIYDIMKALNATYPWIHSTVKRLKKLGLIETVKEPTNKGGLGYKIIIKPLFGKTDGGC